MVEHTCGISIAPYRLPQVRWTAHFARRMRFKGKDQTAQAARIHLSDYFEFHNNERPHETLGYRTPHEVYSGTQAVFMELGV
jgi:transposase InsO family protein